MRYSFEWLKTYVSIRLTPAALAERLTMAGMEIASIRTEGSDSILEVEITPNRPDLLSHIGLAREIAALTGGKLKLSHSALRTPRSARSPLRISVQDRRGCPRYTGRFFDAVQVGVSPRWLREPLERLGLRSVNTVVDITNFVLLEWGQPLHVFDYDRISGGKLIVRAAKNGEKLITIDGEARTLKEGQLVIADCEKPVALAGVIGGKNSEISMNTRRVVLESAFFDPVRIRQSARSLGIATESSYRFERGVSWEGVLQASERAAALLYEVAHAKPVGPGIDLGKKPAQPKAISLNIARLHETLGASVGSKQSASFLTSLGCKVSGKGASLRVVPASFRRDLQQEVDLTEEIARFFGYDRIPLSLPPIQRSRLKENGTESLSRRLTIALKRLLVSQGLFEAVTYSLLSRTLQKHFSQEPAIAIQNPLSLEQELLRRSLLPRLVEVAARNFHHKAEGVSIFETGAVYETDPAGAPRERQSLGIVMAGKTPSDWKVKARPYDYFDVKGICALILETAGIRWTPREKTVSFLGKDKGPAAVVSEGGEEIGYYGELALSVRRALDIESPVYVAELDLSELFQIAAPFVRHRPLSKYPLVTRDLSLIIKDGISSRTLEEAIQRTGGPFLHRAFLFDEYADPSHKVVPKGSRSLAYRMEFLHPDRTLTQQEVDQAVQSVQKALTDLGAQIRIGPGPS